VARQVGFPFCANSQKNRKIPDLVLPQSDSPTHFFANGLISQLGLILPAVSENLQKESDMSDLALSDVIVSVARSVVEANRVLSEGSTSPMGISEFRVKLNLTVGIDVPVKRRMRLSEAYYQVLGSEVQALRLRDVAVLGLRERLFTGALQSANLEITSTIERLPVISTTP
jgi:hypothetical protein